MVRLCIALMVMTLLVGCGAAPEAAAPTATPEPTCQQQATSFVTEVQPIFQEWTDATTLAGSTPRASLSTEIGKLQELRRRVQALQVPACAELVRQNLVTMMDGSIQAYTAFLGQKPENDVSMLFAVATQYTDLFSRNLAHLQANETLEDAPKSVTGLGKRADIYQPYEQEGFKLNDSSPVNGVPRIMGLSSDEVIVVELIGPEDNVEQASVFISGFPAHKDRAVTAMRQLLKTTMPDWSSGEAWLNEKVQSLSSPAQMIAVGNRIVSIEGIGTGNDLTAFLVVRVLQ